MLSPNPIQVEKYVINAQYPASKSELINCAENNQAPSIVLAMLNRLDEQIFPNVYAVSKLAGRWH